jgi:hypothetical protein
MPMFVGQPHLEDRYLIHRRSGIALVSSSAFDAANNPVSGVEAQAYCFAYGVVAGFPQ